MEKWKIAVIAALLLSLVGFGAYQQTHTESTLPGAASPSATPAPSPYLGKTLPAWNFKTWSNQPVSLDSLKGKPALIEIFRIECPHCNAAAPFMVGVQNRYGPRGLKIVAIQSPGAFKQADNPENKWSNVQTWIKQNGINYPVAMDEKSAYFQGTMTKQLLDGDSSKILYPTTLVQDAQGRVIFGHTGYETGTSDGVSKILDLAIELEKLFPGSKSPDQNAKSLLDWLKDFVPDLNNEGNLKKALTDDIAQRLKQK